MMNDPAEARKNVSPIIVCVSKDGTHTIIDGNHTSQAIVKAGWTSAPVIYINESEFLNKQSNIDHFGIIANHNPKIKKPNSTQDCQRAIINLYKNNLAEQDEDFKLLDGSKFKETCENILYPAWSKQQVSGNLKSARERIKTNYAEAQQNFQTYSETELKGIVSQVKAENPNLAVIYITSGKMFNSGVGAILNKMGGLNTREGMIVASHGNIGEYNSRKESLKKLKAALKLIHPDCKVTLLFVNCFDKNNNVHEKQRLT